MNAAALLVRILSSNSESLVSHNMLNLRISFAFVIGFCLTSPALAQVIAGYKTNIPKQIMTPEKVETSIGTFEFFVGCRMKQRFRRCTTILTEGEQSKSF